jgi:hypothetical protein
MQKITLVLWNTTLINLFNKKIELQYGTLITSIVTSIGCSCCKYSGHEVKNCLNIGEDWPQCAKCGYLHRIEKCGMKCTTIAGGGDILKIGVTRSQKRRKDLLQLQKICKFLWMMKRQCLTNLIKSIKLKNRLLDDMFPRKGYMFWCHQMKQRLKRLKKREHAQRRY